MAISIDNTYLTRYSTEAADSATSKLTSQIRDADTADKTMEACEQFEAYLIQQMFKNMEKTAEIFSDDGEDSDTNSQYLDIFNDTYLENIASTMMKNGQGLGIAEQLYESIQRNSGFAAESAAADLGKVTE